MLTEAQAWEVLATIPDPEIPVLSVCDLGIVREVRSHAQQLTVVVTPTYSGCPATEVIEQSIRAALQQAGAGDVRIETRLSPAWTTDWISAAARDKLRAYGIVPPGAIAGGSIAGGPIVDGPIASGTIASGAIADGPITGGPFADARARPVRFMPRPKTAPLDCPRCGSQQTTRLSAFGSTACKALWRCDACGEPFEQFKAI